MKVRMLTSLGGNAYTLAPGDEYSEFTDHEAIRLIDAEYAEACDPAEEAKVRPIVEAEWAEASHSDPQSGEHAEAAEAAEKEAADKAAADAAEKEAADKAAAEAAEKGATDKAAVEAAKKVGQGAKK